MSNSALRLVVACILALSLASAAAQSVGFVEAGSSFSVPIRSQKAARFAATLQQQFDFSCGSAAVATLLTYHYGQPTSESAAFEAMFSRGDTEKIRKEGFSLLDLKRFLATRGFDADGFELPLEKLQEARIPAIVLITDNGYNHFVVVKGLRDGRVLIGDPSSGTRLMARERFENSGRACSLCHSQPPGPWRASTRQATGVARRCLRWGLGPARFARQPRHSAARAGRVLAWRRGSVSWLLRLDPGAAWRRRMCRAGDEAGHRRGLPSATVPSTLCAAASTTARPHRFVAASSVSFRSMVRSSPAKACRSPI